MNMKRVLSIGLLFLTACAYLSACKEDDTVPAAPTVSFDKQITVVDDIAEFKFVITNPGLVTLVEIGVDYGEDISGASTQNYIIETNNKEASKTVEVKLKLDANKAYWVEPYVISSNTTSDKIKAGRASLETQSPRWHTLKSFPGEGRDKAAIFAIASRIYVGLGKGKTDIHQDFWVYDTTTDTWAQLSDFPGGGRYDVVSFALNGKGYVGGGASSNDSDLKTETDLWQYDPEGDSWMQVDDLPYPDVNEPSAFSSSSFISSQGSGTAYYGTGIYFGFDTPLMYRFDPANTSWTEIEPLPIPGFSFCSFIIGNRLFAGIGRYYGSNSISYTKRLFMYDPLTGSWTEKAGLPEQASLGLFADKLTSFAIDDYGYILTNQGELWKYDAAGDQWTKDQEAELIYRDESILNNRMLGTSNTQMVVSEKRAYGGLGIVNTYVNDVYIHTPGNSWMSFDPLK
jgi:hypothetical protein